MGRPAESVLDDVEVLVRERTGLRVNAASRDRLGAVIDERLAALGVTPSDYTGLLASSSPATGELELLVHELTVGESYFFRNVPQFDVLRAHIIPDLVEKRSPREPRTLRVMSAGCAGGEEPYSLAIALREELDAVDEWQLDVLGVDINTSFLERALKGGFSEWSLRGVPDEVRARYFRSEGNRYHLDDVILEMVRFRYLNLATSSIPDPSIGIVAVDLIVCRNVLYYFERELRNEVLERLARCLAPGGWLVVGPTDILDAQVPHCRPRSFAGLTFYERTDKLELPSAAPPSYHPPTRFAFSTAPAPPMPPSMPSLRPSIIPDPKRPSMDDAIALADAGALPEAGKELARILERDSDNARAHQLLGFVQLEQGAPEEALASFRRAIYLNPDLILGHAGIAIVGRRTGQAELDRRHGARVRALAKQLPPSAAVEGWEGMTTARLVRLFEEEDSAPRKEPGRD